MQLEDMFTNPVAAASAQTVTLSSTSSGGAFFASAGSTTPITSVTIETGQTTVSFYYSDSQTGTPTLTALDNSLNNVTASQTATIVTAGATQVVISSAALNSVAGASGQITVQLENGSGSPSVSTSAQTISLMTSSAAGAFYASSTGGSPITSVVIEPGQASTSVYYVDTKAGNPILTASDTALGSTPTQHETITPAAANHLVVTAQPPNPITAGQGFAFVVSAEDKFNNVDTNFTGSVSISLAGDPTFATSVHATNGVASFSGLIVDASVSGLAIQVASTGLSGTATNSLDVTQPQPPPPNTSPAPTVSLENVVLTQKKKKGKPVFSGFMLKFNTAMNSSTAGLAGNYHLFANVVKKVKKKTTTTLKPVPFTVSYSQSSNAVTINVSSTKPFAKGGQITVSGVTSQAGVLLSASDTTFTITANAKGIILA